MVYLGWVNGCFDGNELHEGHIALLNYAKSLCLKLVIGIDSDKRIRETKGEGRPIRNSWNRGKSLFHYADEIVEFNTDAELEGWIKHFSPDICVKGSDWEGKEIIGAKYCKEIIYFPRVEGVSTTEIIKKASHKEGN